MKCFFVFLGLSTLLAASAASAGYVDGMALRRYCDKTDPFNSRCTAYIAGVLDDSDRARCLPDGTDLQVLAKVVRDHLDKVENSNRHNAAGLVKQAIDGAYPCQ